MSRDLQVVLEVTVEDDADDLAIADRLFEVAMEDGLGDSVETINNSWPQ